MAANAIAENLFSQIDDEGNRHVLFDESVDHRTNGKQITQQDAFVVTRTGTRRRRETMVVGWEFLVRWKDGTTTWVAKKDMKVAYPVQAAKYAVQSSLAEEPAFVRAPIMIWWFSKRQNTVETSTFGSKFQAMKNATELVEALRYKLRTFGVPIDGATNVFCDIEAVYKNTSLQESTLKKKHHAIACHRCLEAVTTETVRVAKEGTVTNLSDLFGPGEEVWVGGIN
ncbi:Reverse transcriptase (RNA-dependent DNA polymerase) [Fragilaria crotonensis]|nr:Reverse transcriptase (RNA-dependent DNA polymerase) [Fragilaria crotonensis]